MGGDVTAITATHFPSLTNAQGQRFTTTWSKLLERLSLPRISADKHAVPGLSLATFAGDRRALANVERVFAVGLDLDEAVDLSDLRGRFNAHAAFVHTTWSSTLFAPRCRVFLLLSRPVTGDEYRRVYRHIAGIVEAGGLVVDRAASDPSRFWFLPCVREEGSAFVYWTCTGGPVDVGAALAAEPPPTPPPPMPSSKPSVGGWASPVDRARKYLAKCPGAIQGSGGSNVTLMVAIRMVRGFDLSVDEAYALIANDYNPRCVPPWGERELRRKVEEAAAKGRMAPGELLAKERAR